MNIGSRNWGVGNAEQTYRNTPARLHPQNRPRPEGIDRPGKPAQKMMARVESPSDILTQRELATLHALFNSTGQDLKVYGGSKIQNIQSGYLLDVKG